MTSARIDLAGEVLEARPSGALWWPSRQVLVVGDLHLGRAERLARQGGGLLPPYETSDTLNRLEAEVGILKPKILISLGDSFDDLAAARHLADEAIARLKCLAAGRRLIWIAGNHDPGPLDLPGAHLAETRLGAVVFRHIAEAAYSGAEVSAHFHPKAQIRLKGRSISRKCFLLAGDRLILPAFGTYTGGLDVCDPAFAAFRGRSDRALMLGKRIVPIDMAELDARR